MRTFKKNIMLNEMIFNKAGFDHASSQPYSKQFNVWLFCLHIHNSLQIWQNFVSDVANAFNFLLRTVKSEKQLTAAKRKTSDSTESLASERRTPRGSGGSRTPREERVKERLSTEDMRVQKSKEILLRPGKNVTAKY